MSLVKIRLIIGISKITKDKFPLRFMKKKQKEFSFEFVYAYLDAYVDRFSGFLVLSFVLPFDYAYVASEDQALMLYSGLKVLYLKHSV